MGAIIDGPIWTGLEELRGMLRSLLSRHCADPNEVEDVIHETFLRAVRYRSSLSGGGRLKSWTTRIALNVLHDRKRRRGRYLPVTEEGALDVAAPPSSEEEEQPVYRIGRWELEKDAALRAIERAMGGMRADDRRVLDSFYRGAQSCRETASECDIPAHLVKVRLFRARQRLLRTIRRRLALEQV